MKYDITIKHDRANKTLAIGDRVEFSGVDMGLGSKIATLAAISRHPDVDRTPDMLAIRMPGRSFQSGNYGALSRSYAPAEIAVVRVLQLLERADQAPSFRVEQVFAVSIKREVRER